MNATILQGDCLQSLRTLPDESVHCVVTSPPYWGLRDYGCAGQIGLEATVDEFIERLVVVFTEVRRVLRNDGTCWVNMGDCYATRAAVGLRPKNLLGQPWRLAFALQASGWYLRQDIIWHKPAPMPESVADRCTKAHEYLFLLAKSERYHWDAAAMREPVTGGAHARRSFNGVGFGHGYEDKPRWTPKTPHGWGVGDEPRRSVEFQRNGVHPKARAAGSGTRANASFCAAVSDLVKSRNRRSVWTIPAEPCSDAHFATFPTALVRPCILAGCPVGGTVLDPFGGSGTTAAVAIELGRNAILCELNPDYVALAKARLAAVTPGLALS